PPVSTHYFASPIVLPPTPPLFPYTTLFRSARERAVLDGLAGRGDVYAGGNSIDTSAQILHYGGGVRAAVPQPSPDMNLKRVLARSEEHTSDSSHQIISYAVFCLKKKK